MNKRSFIKSMSVMCVVLACPALARSADANKPEIHVAYARHAAVEVWVTGRGGTDRVTFENSQPQRIARATVPMAISISEEPERFRLNVFRVRDDGQMSLMAHYYFLGASTHRLMTYGVSLSIRPVAAG